MNTPENQKQLSSGAQPAARAERVRLVSVGHSNHDWPAFLALLQQAGITALADVRSSPYSRWLPYFNKGPLESALRTNGIAYIFLGDLLGGRPSSPSLYDDEGRVDYERVRQTEAFQQGLGKLTRGLIGSSVAFLCSEEDPLDCHRGLMIAPALKANGFRPEHLRKDGAIETQEEMESRLLCETGVGAGLLDGLFAATLTEEDRTAFLAEAYRKMARRKAFRLSTDGDAE